MCTPCESKTPAFHHADLLPLTGGIRSIDMDLDEIGSAGKAFTLIALAADVPPVLRRYYAKIGKQLTDTRARLKVGLDSAILEGNKLKNRLEKKLGHPRLTEEDLERLHQVNTRLLLLEQSLSQTVYGLRERLEGFSPDGAEWDDWDAMQIILWVKIGANLERPAYHPEAWVETGIMEPLEIRIRISDSWVTDTAEGTEPWNLDDGKSDRDLSWCEGHPLQHFPQSRLFHEILDHGEVDVWGMLHLQSLRIEVIPHRTSEFWI